MSHADMAKQRQLILHTLEPLFQRAIEQGLWFFAPYQSMWFSPAELRTHHAAGRFIWGPPNWELRSPKGLFQQAQASVEAASLALENVKSRLAKAGLA